MLVQHILRIHNNTITKYISGFIYSMFYYGTEGSGALRLRILWPLLKNKNES